jgi:hypothetical protein
MIRSIRIVVDGHRQNVIFHTVDNPKANPMFFVGFIAESDTNLDMIVLEKSRPAKLERTHE